MRGLQITRYRLISMPSSRQRLVVASAVKDLSLRQVYV